jgi:NTE family protein
MKPRLACEPKIPPGHGASRPPGRRSSPFPGRRFLASLLVLLCGALPFPTAARAEDEPVPPRLRPLDAPPKVALVLSGGGARGAAEVGVLKVLREMKVPVDLVVGTSIGSIVGGLYAAGWEPEEIEKVLTDLTWRKVFVDQVDREDKTFRRKGDDDVFLVATRLRFKGWKPKLPPSVIAGQRLEVQLRSLEIESTSETDFNRFPIPYRAVAADLATGQAVILDHGSLATSMRASMSIAGVFPPVELDGRKLVDGGAVANLPVRIARRLGAERIIAVDISSPLTEEAKLGSLLSIFNQMGALLTTGNRQEDLRRLREGDVLIQPDLGDITYADLERTEEAVEIGERTARAMADKLRPFAVSDEEYARFLEGHHRRPLEELHVDRVRLDNTTPTVDDRLIEKRLPDQAGRPFDDGAVRQNLMRLSGLEYFGVIRDDLAKEGDQQVLTIHTPPKPYGRNSLQFGFSFRDDFQGENGYTLAARHLFLAANRRGGEWENVGQIGDRAILRSVFYQPLDWSMKWFATFGGEILREDRTLWEGSDPVADFRLGADQGGLGFGRVLGRWGQLGLDGYAAHNEGFVRVGTPLIPDYNEHDGGLRFSFKVDTRDEVVFPRRGTWIDSWYNRSLRDFGADAGRAQAYLLAQQAWSFGRNTLVPEVEALKTVDGTVTLNSSYNLGGVFRLSGLGTDQLVGESGGLATLAYYRELSRLDLGALTSRVYAGVSVEAGNVYQAGEPVTFSSLQHGGSVYLGAQTAIGPAFLGVGFADGGERRFYFMVGQRF